MSDKVEILRRVYVGTFNQGDLGKRLNRLGIEFWSALPTQIVRESYVHFYSGDKRDPVGSLAVSLSFHPDRNTIIETLFTNDKKGRKKNDELMVKFGRETEMDLEIAPGEVAEGLRAGTINLIELLNVHLENKGFEKFMTSRGYTKVGQISAEN